MDEDGWQVTDEVKRWSRSLKDTLNLPKTAFAMKANLPQNEPARLARWKAEDLYGEIRKARAGAPKFILHDGPPYANGAIHLGHALNKCIKDFVVKTKTMAGFDAPYVPGWDCHGLPIEIKVDEQLGRQEAGNAGGERAAGVPGVCAEVCRSAAVSVRADWACWGVGTTHTLTMSFAYEARFWRRFMGSLRKAFVYKGLKPVFWCIHDQTALAEAEVEYEHAHFAECVCAVQAEIGRGGDCAGAGAGREVYTIIWTTTPWTIPASQAVAFNPEMEYVALDGGGGGVPGGGGAAG